MMVCTFFGHRECPDLKAQIRAVLEELAEKFAFTDFEPFDERSRVVRFCTSWATEEANVDALCAELTRLTEKNQCS